MKNVFANEHFSVNFLDGTTTFYSETGESMTVSNVFVGGAFHAWERQMTYRSDLIERIEKMVNDGLLPEEALKNEAFIEAALDEYERLREDDEEEVEAKLDETFEGIDYEEYKSIEKKKYELTDDTIIYDGHELHHIRRLSDGEYGGYIEREENLSQSGRCWVEMNSYVYGNARVADDAIVGDDPWGGTIVSGDAFIHEHAIVVNSTVKDHVEIKGNAFVCSAVVYDNVLICDDARLDVQCCGIHLHGNAKFFGHAKIEEPVDIGEGAYC